MHPEGNTHVPMLAEHVDGAIGVHTHRDTLGGKCRVLRSVVDCLRGALPRVSAWT